MKKQLAIKLKFISKKRNDSYARTLHEMRRDGSVRSSGVLLLYRDAENSFDSILQEIWAIYRLELQTESNSSDMVNRVEDTKKDFTKYAVQEFRTIVKEVEGMLKNDKLYDKKVGLHRARKSFKEHCKNTLLDSIRVIEEFKNEQIKRIDSNKMQQELVNTTRRQTLAAWISVCGVLILLAVTFINVVAVRTTTQLTKDYVNATVELVETTKKQHQLTFEEWQEEHVPRIIADYSINWFDKYNTNVAVYVKNVGKATCNNLTYFIDVPKTKGTIQRMYSDQEQVILEGNIQDHLDRMKKGFTVTVQYNNGKDRVSQNIPLKLDLAGKRPATLSDIHRTLERLLAEFEIGDGTSSTYNIQSLLFRMNRSLTKIANNISKRKE